MLQYVKVWSGLILRNLAVNDCLKIQGIGLNVLGDPFKSKFLSPSFSLLLSSAPTPFSPLHPFQQYFQRPGNIGHKIIKVQNLTGDRNIRRGRREKKSVTFFVVVAFFFLTSTTLKPYLCMWILIPGRVLSKEKRTDKSYICWYHQIMHRLCGICWPDTSPLKLVEALSLPSVGMGPDKTAPHTSMQKYFQKPRKCTCAGMWLSFFHPFKGRRKAKPTVASQMVGEKPSGGGGREKKNPLLTWAP